MSWYTEAFGRHYPLLYRHRDDGEARRCIESLTGLADLGEGPVLDLACGQGRHLPFVSGLGVTVVGLDLSPFLLARAREAMTAGPHRTALLRADMRRVPLAAGSVSTVLSLFTSFGYFGGLAEHAGLVAEIARVLRSGGHWFLDYLNCLAVQRELSGGQAQADARRMEPLLVRQQRRLRAAPLRVVKEVRLEPLPGGVEAAGDWGIPPAGLSYTEEVALFTLAEIDALAGTCGLHRVAQAGDYDGGPLQEETSPRWLLVYRKSAHGQAESTGQRIEEKT